MAIVFAGGPAPAANAVISAAADSFMRNNVDVVGIMNGYSQLGAVRARAAGVREGRAAKITS